MALFGSICTLPLIPNIIPEPQPINIGRYARTKAVFGENGNNPAIIIGAARRRGYWAKVRAGWRPVRVIGTTMGN